MSDRPPPRYQSPLGDDPFADRPFTNSSSTFIPHPNQLRWPTHYPITGTYYIVTVGHEVGIFTTWAEAASATNNVRESIHQSVQGWYEAIRIWDIAHTANIIRIIPRPTPYRRTTAGSHSQPIVVPSSPATPTRGGPQHPIAVLSSPAATPSPHSGARGSIHNPQYVGSSPAPAYESPARPSRTSASPAPHATTPARPSRVSASPAPSSGLATPGHKPRASASIAPPFALAQARHATPSTPTRRANTPQASAMRERIIEDALRPSPASRASDAPRTPTQSQHAATRTPTPIQHPVTTLSNEEFASRIRAVEDALLFYSSRNGGRMPPPASPAPNMDYYEARLGALEACVKDLLTQEAARAASREHLAKLFAECRARLMACAAVPSSGVKQESPEQQWDGRDATPPRPAVAGSSTGFGTSSYVEEPHSPITLADYSLDLEGDVVFSGGFDDFTEEQQQLANQLLDDVSNAYAKFLDGKGKGKQREQ